MADRTVKVSLTASVSGYLAGMEQARKKTGEVSDEAQKKLAAQGRAFGDLGAIAVKAGVVVAAGIGLAIARFAEFDQAMSQVQAATQASADDMGLLRDAALEAGASTVYTAKEAANAIEELGKAGLTTAQIVGGGLKGALTLAAAGGIEVADAAQFAATALKQFNLEGGDLPHVADLLAAGAGKAVGDVDDLAQALNQAGLIANGAGFSIEETTGVLAAFADAGLLGSDAGTSLKTAIVALQAPTGKARDLLDQYGLSVYDANGNMLGFSEIAGQLQEKLGGLTDEQRNAALATIFGTDALRSANVLYTQGAEGIQKYIDQTNDSGYAAKVAADRLDNLAGDVEKLGGSFDTALIKSGSGANDVLRGLVQSATFLTDAVGDMPEPLLAVGLGLGSVTAALLITGGAAAIAVPKFAALKATVELSGVSMSHFTRNTAALGGALGAATLIVGYFVAKQAQAAATTSELQDSLDEASGATTKYTRELVAKKLAESGAFDSAKNLNISQKELTDAVLEGGDALDEINRKFTAQNNIVDFFNGSGIAASFAQDSIKELTTGLKESKENFEDEAAAAGDSADSTMSASAAYFDAASNAATLTDNLLTLIDTINKSNEVGQDAVSTNAAYQQTLADVTDYLAQARKGVDDYSLGWDKNTVAGSANQDMLRGLAADSQAAAEAQLALDGNTDAYLSTVTAANQLLYDQARAFGATESEARDFADSIYAIPSAHETQLIADTAEASRRILEFKKLLEMPQVVITPELRASSGYYANRATGGAITGPGTGTSDTAGLFNLSNGEHVLTAEDVKRMGGQSGVYAFRDSLYGGYAKGGAVQYAPSREGGGSPINVKQEIYTTDPGVAADMAAQRLRASLAGL